MRFSTIHKLSAYLMASSALASVLLSAEIGLPTTAITIGAVILSWFADPARFRLERFTAAWNIATVLFFFYLVSDVVRGGALILAGADFLLFVLCNKLFNRRTSRDYLQAVVVSFLLLVVATTLNTSLSYAVAFAAYVVFATWTLILLHLRREMEENYLLKHSEGAKSEKVEVERILSSSRVVGARFLAGTSLLSLGVILASGMVFLLFPRVGFGLFLGQKRTGMGIAGFQDRIELGHHGLVRDNPSVVMRVGLPADPGSGRLLWRGSVFDLYQAGTWSHAPDVAGQTQVVHPRDGLHIINVAPGMNPRATPRQLRAALLRQEIYLEPLDSNVLFAADRPVAIEAAARGPGPRTSFLYPRRGPFGEMRTATARSAGVYYIAYSQVKPPPLDLLRQAEPLGDRELEAYLQLPAELPRRVRELAQQIVRGKTVLLDRVLAVQQHLRARYAYTLQLTHKPGTEPVDEFLFDTRRGHCEYFASAMVLLLRSLSIHARNVNGFAGGVWNSFGRYVAVRQGDAHSWVEVLFPNYGWVAFDPTPPSAAGSTPTGALATVGQLLDSLRMRWYRHVIEYDLRQQVSMLRDVQRWLAPRRAPGQQRRVPWLLLGGAGLVVVAAILIWRRRRRPGAGPLWRRGSRRAQKLPAISQVYLRLLAALARAGHPKPPGMTPRELCDVLRARGFGPLRLVERITGCYYDVRFGGQPLRAETAEELTSLLRELQRALQARQSLEGR